MFLFMLFENWVVDSPPHLFSLTLYNWWSLTYQKLIFFSILNYWCSLNICSYRTLVASNYPIICVFLYGDFILLLSLSFIYLYFIFVHNMYIISWEFNLTQTSDSQVLMLKSNASHTYSLYFHFISFIPRLLPRVNITLLYVRRITFYKTVFSYEKCIMW